MKLLDIKQYERIKTLAPHIYFSHLRGLSPLGDTDI